MSPLAPRDLIYRCAGPNCGQVKGASDRWWLMWNARAPNGQPTLTLCEWDEELAQQYAALHVCGEGCAQKLQSVFMSNVRTNRDHERQRSIGAR
ncbi:MAG: hypothetical protein ACE14L_12990 [Terriglobales bacterium]